MYCLECDAFGEKQYYSIKGELTTEKSKAKLYRKRSDAAKGKSSMVSKLKKHSWHTELINLDEAIGSNVTKGGVEDTCIEVDDVIEVSSVTEDIVDKSKIIEVGNWGKTVKSDTEVHSGDIVAGKYGRVVLKEDDILNVKTNVSIERVAQVAEELKGLLDEMWADRDYILETNEKYNILENELRHYVEFTKFNVVDGYQMNKLEHDFRESRRKIKDACDIIHKIPAMLNDASKELNTYVSIMRNRKFKYTMIEDTKASEGVERK